MNKSVTGGRERVVKWKERLEDLKEFGANVKGQAKREAKPDHIDDDPDSFHCADSKTLDVVARRTKPRRAHRR